MKPGDLLWHMKSKRLVSVLRMKRGSPMVGCIYREIVDGVSRERETAIDWRELREPTKEERAGLGGMMGAPPKPNEPPARTEPKCQRCGHPLSMHPTVTIVIDGADAEMHELCATKEEAAALKAKADEQTPAEQTPDAPKPDPATCQANQPQPNATPQAASTPAPTKPQRQPKAKQP